MSIPSDLKIELERRAKKTKDRHEYTRLCVILARSEGMSHELIAQAHRISIQSVYRYLAEYQSEEKTKHDRRGGSRSKLDKSQTFELIRHLEETTYLHAKTICSYVKVKYCIDYTVSGITCWLNAHGFVYKEPVKIPGKLDPEKQENFIQNYESFKKGLKKDEKLFFMDAVHPEFQSKAVCGWIKKGEMKTLPTTSAQYRMHFIGALSIEGMQLFAKEYQTVDGENMIAFLKELEQSVKGKTIHMICDNGRANKNKKVEEYLKTSRIKIHYLPPYSPNLNPIERLWKILREKKTYNKYYEKFADFKEEVKKFFFEEVPKMKQELASRITDNFQRIQLNTVKFVC